MNEEKMLFGSIPKRHRLTKFLSLLTIIFLTGCSDEIEGYWITSGPKIIHFDDDKSFGINEVRYNYELAYFKTWERIDENTILITVKDSFDQFLGTEKCHILTLNDTILEVRGCGLSNSTFKKISDDEGKRLNQTINARTKQNLNDR